MSTLSQIHHPETKVQFKQIVIATDFSRFVTMRPHLCALARPAVWFHSFRRTRHGSGTERTDSVRTFAKRIKRAQAGRGTGNAPTRRECPTGHC